MAGLLARGSSPDADLPDCSVVTDRSRLAAYSCGGSHGLGPDWVVRTVFPINPLEFIRRGTIARDDTRAPNPDQSGFAFAMER